MSAPSMQHYVQLHLERQCPVFHGMNLPLSPCTNISLYLIRWDGPVGMVRFQVLAVRNAASIDVHVQSLLMTGMASLPLG